MFPLQPKGNKSRFFLICGLAFVIQAGLALLVQELIKPQPKQRLRVQSVPLYRIVSHDRETPREPEQQQPLVAAQRPVSAAQRPSFTDIKFPDLPASFSIPDVPFRSDLDFKITPRFSFDSRAIKVAESSQIQSKIRMARPTYQIPPHYPARAKRNGIEGQVIVDLLIDKEGKPQQHNVITEKPKGVFLQSTLRAVLRWRFAPPEQNQEWQRLIVNYKLER